MKTIFYTAGTALSKSHAVPDCHAEMVAMLLATSDEIYTSTENVIYAAQALVAEGKIPHPIRVVNSITGEIDEINQHGALKGRSEWCGHVICDLSERQLRASMAILKKERTESRARLEERAKARASEESKHEKNDI